MCFLFSFSLCASIGATLAKDEELWSRTTNQLTWRWCILIENWSVLCFFFISMIISCSPTKQIFSSVLSKLPKLRSISEQTVILPWTLILKCFSTRASLKETSFHALIKTFFFHFSSLKVGNLFGSRRSTIITLYNGAFDSSSALFLIIKVANTNLRRLFRTTIVLTIYHVSL